MDEGADLAAEALALSKELIKYDDELGEKERWLVINKIDMAVEESVEEKTALIKDALGFAGKTFFISALAKQGLEPLKYAVMDYLDGMEDDF